MKAIVWGGPERMAVHERPEPPDPAAHELILRPEAVGICVWGAQIRSCLGRGHGRPAPASVESGGSVASCQETALAASLFYLAVRRLIERSCCA